MTSFLSPSSDLVSPITTTVAPTPTPLITTCGHPRSSSKHHRDEDTFTPPSEPARSSQQTIFSQLPCGHTVLYLFCCTTVCPDLRASVGELFSKSVERTAFTVVESFRLTPIFQSRCSPLWPAFLLFAPLCHYPLRRLQLLRLPGEGPNANVAQASTFLSPFAFFDSQSNQLDRGNVHQE
jgi:hypothetical protein